MYYVGRRLAVGNRYFKKYENFSVGTNANTYFTYLPIQIPVEKKEFSDNKASNFHFSLYDSHSTYVDIFAER